MGTAVRSVILSIVILGAVVLSSTAASASRYRPHPTPTPTVVPTATPSPTASTGYSGAVAASYADTYWSSYNSAYPSFANSGGDCTNFVSQALYAGGIAMRPTPPYTGNAAWFISSSGGQWSYSNPWVNANDDDIFLLQDLPGVTQVASYVGVAAGQIVPSNASEGDVVLYDWNNDGIFDHEAIISTADGQYVDAHTSNRYHQYWTLAQYNTQWATTHIVVLHIPSTTH
jgi:hypothetical protein